MNKYYVYIYFNPFEPGGNYGPLLFENKPFYVGKGHGSRYRQHIWNHVGNNKEKIEEIKDIKRRGVEPIVILYKQYMSETEALSLEKEIVSLIGRKDLGKGPLLNRTDGGNFFSNCNMSEAGRRRIGEAGRLRKGKASPELIEKRRRLWTGSKNPNYGGKVTRGLESPLKGRKRPPEFGADLSKKLKSYFTNPDNRLKMRRVGTSNGRCKLTQEQVHLVRTDTTTSAKELALRYNVSTVTIYGIKAGRYWKSTS